MPPSENPAPSQSGNNNRNRLRFPRNLRGRLKIGRITGRVEPVSQTNRPASSGSGSKPSANRHDRRVVPTPRSEFSDLSRLEDNPEELEPQNNDLAEPRDEQPDPTAAPKSPDDQPEPGMPKTSGNQPSDSRGEPTNKKRGGQKQGAPPSNLRRREQSPTDTDSPGNDGLDPGWYRPTGVGGLTSNQQKWLLRHRKKVLGGGLVGFLLSLVLLLSVASGPLQFIQLGRLLEQFHLTSQNETQDNRFVRNVRYIHGRYFGTLERTRMGYLSNAVADRFESKLNASGLRSAYSERYGLFDGYIIDRTNSKFRGMGGEEIKAYFSQQGIEVTDGSTTGKPGLKGELVINAKKGYFSSRSMNNILLKDAGYKGLASYIGSRLLCQRAACTLNPLKKLVGTFKDADERRREAKKQDTQARTAQVEEGVNSPKYNTNADATESKDPTADPAAAQEADKQAKDTLKAAEDAKAVSSTDPTAYETARSKVFKVGGLTGASLIAVACIAQHVDNKGSEIKQAQVRAPLIRSGVRMLAIRSAIEDGKKVDPDILAAEAGQLHGKVTLNGKEGKTMETSWIDSKSIQHNLGHTDRGVAAPTTLDNLGDNTTPFHFLNQNAVVRTGLNVACNPAAALVSVVFLGFGVKDVVAAAVNAFFTPVIEREFVRWASGQALDPNPIGSDLGSFSDYGMHLAANDKIIAGGGTELTPAESALLSNFNQQNFQSEYNSKSFAYKLFNTSDPRTAISQVINHSSNSPTKNIASLGSSLMNLSRSFGSLFSVFSHPALAATNAPYDYGIPTYGFSQQDLDNPAVSNPHDNAARVVSILERSDGQSFITKASNCFGVSIEPEEVTLKTGKVVKQWGVTSSRGDVIDVTKENYRANHCNEPIPADCTNNDSEPCNWLRVRFFILDTETMNSMACYESDGSDSSVEQACADIGFGDSSQDSSSEVVNGSGGTVTADCNVTKPVWGSVNGVGSQYSQEQLTRIFGDPGTVDSHPQMDANLVSVDFLGHSLKVNVKAAGCLKAVADEISSSHINYAITDMGCYRFDSNNGISNIGLRSYHTYGVACDINPGQNPFVKSGAVTSHDMPQSIVKAFYNHGFTWGGNWHQPKDYMHFDFNGIVP